MKPRVYEHKSFVNMTDKQRRTEILYREEFQEILNFLQSRYNSTGDTDRRRAISKITDDIIGLV